ncbi:MAG: endonuclease/exonuclease/phosphatase family protein [Eubacteriales bacterium]
MKNKMLKTVSLALALFLLLPCVLFVSGCTDGTPDDSSSGDTTADETEIRKIFVADLSNYTLVRPEKVSEQVLERIGVLNQKLRSSTPISGYKDDFYREGFPGFAIGEYEILVGKTNRAESKQFLADLKYHDYGFALVGNKIVIAGHSDEATCNAIDEFILTVMQNDDREEGVFFSSEYNYLNKLEYNVKDIYIGDASITDYRIVYAEKNSASEKNAAEKIAAKIAEVSGIVVDVVSDDEDNGIAEYEILVGATNRNTDAEIAQITSDLGATEALIKYDGKKIGIYGLTSTAILVAAGNLTDRIKSDKTDKLTVTLDAEIQCKYDDSVLSAMSFNVWVSGRTDERDERVVQMVKNYQPDTVGFQEVNSAWLSVLSGRLRDQYDYVGVGRDGGTRGEYNPIFYKKDVFNLIESGTKWLSATPDEVSKFEESSLNRIYTYALLERKSDGIRVLVVNTHFDHKSDEARAKQAQVLVAYLQKNSEYPVILTGDFNCQRDTTPYSTLISCGIKNSYDVADQRLNNDATFTSYGSASKIIDFAFVNPMKISVISYKVCSEKVNGDYPSDHHPVLIEYTIIN